MDKVINKITAIDCSLVGKEGYAVTLTANGTVGLCRTGDEEPYGIVVKGCDSVTPGIYPSAVLDGSLEIMSEVGQCAMVWIGDESLQVTCNDWMQPGLDSSFCSIGEILRGYQVWGIALNDATNNTFCMIRFQPSYIWTSLT